MDFFIDHLSHYPDDKETGYSNVLDLESPAGSAHFTAACVRRDQEDLGGMGDGDSVGKVESFKLDLPPLQNQTKP